MRLGTPHLHLRTATSTNDRARELAGAGAPHGTLVTADEQTAGRGRQGRTWSAPAGRALLCSVVLRDPPALLPLVGAVAAAAACGPDTQVKWPNDVWDAEGRKLCGILAEGRPQEGWAVLGVGINVAVRPGDLPAELAGRAGSLGLDPGDVARVRGALLRELEGALALEEAELLAAWAARDALRGRGVRWAGGDGIADGIDAGGRLRVRRADGSAVALDAGEVHLH